MKKTLEYKKKELYLHCDNCGKPIEDLEHNWKEGAFQSGITKDGEIASFCNEICSAEFEVLGQSPSLSNSLTLNPHEQTNK